MRGDQLNGDQGWDPIWTAATKIDAQGWTAEMRIPYSQLRFSRDSVQLWGMQIWRYEDRLNERDMWSFWKRSDAGGPAYFGTVEGIRIGARPRQLEILPYVLTGEQLQHANANDPFQGSHDTRIRAGGDVKYLLTSNLTLDATFYPDFGQVEVDPATLNLSPYETFYDEKRPFFIAGSSAFDFGGMSCKFCSNTSGLSLFYSRRIGRLPQLSDWVQGQSTFADAPDYTPIIGAAKITGRTNGGYTVGLLDAVTSSQSERYITASAPTPLRQAVEPLSNYFVGRVQKELNSGNSAIGVALTSTARRLGDTVLTDHLREQGRGGGARLDAHVASSRLLVGGKRGAVERRRIGRIDRGHRALERALFPAPGSRRARRRLLRRVVRHAGHRAARIRILHAPGEGQRQLALGS